MSGLSRYQAQRLFDLSLNPSTRTAPTFLALHTASVHDFSYGAETNFSGYERQALDSMYSEFLEEANGEVVLVARNGAIISFPFSAGPLAVVTHWAIWDAAETGAGNVLYSGPLNFSKLVEAGDRVVLKADDIVIEMR